MTNYGLLPLFPMFLYRGKFETHAKWKDKIFPIIKRRYEEQNGSNSSSWNCDCYTSFFDDSMVDFTKETEIPIGELLQDM